MKLRFQDRLQVPFDDHLGDPVGDRRNPERPRCSSIAFRYVNSAHGWRKVASGRHPIPDPVEILTQIPVEILDGLSIHTRIQRVVINSTFQGVVTYLSTRLAYGHCQGNRWNEG